MFKNIKKVSDDNYQKESYEGGGLTKDDLAKLAGGAINGSLAGGDRGSRKSARSAET
jgi:hypothetical protein